MLLVMKCGKCGQKNRTKPVDSAVCGACKARLFAGTLVEIIPEAGDGEIGARLEAAGRAVREEAERLATPPSKLN